MLINLKETFGKARRVIVQGHSLPLLVDYSQESCSSKRLPIKQMEGLAIRKDYQRCAHIGRRIFVQNPLTPSELGFGCKVMHKSSFPQPTKGSIFKYLKIALK